VPGAEVGLGVGVVLAASVDVGVVAPSLRAATTATTMPGHTQQLRAIQGRKHHVFALSGEWWKSSTDRAGKLAALYRILAVTPASSERSKQNLIGDRAPAD
jgi:hypothetical protein